jgi:hypothetical protein
MDCTGVLVVVRSQGTETCSLIDPDCAFVELGYGEAEAATPEALACKRHSRLREGESESATGQVWAKPQSNDDVVASSSNSKTR